MKKKIVKQVNFPRIIIREKGPHHAEHVITFPDTKSVKAAYRKSVLFYESTKHDAVSVESADKIVVISGDLVASVTVYLKGDNFGEWHGTR